MSASSGLAANSTGAGRPDTSGVRGAGASDGAGGPSGAVPGRVTISPSEATGRSAVGAPGDGSGVAAGGGPKTSAVTVGFVHPATIIAGISIETASARTRWFVMIPPGFGGCRALLWGRGPPAPCLLCGRSPTRSSSPRGPLHREPVQPSQGHTDPGRAMVDLVPDLVQSLVQLEHAQDAIEREPRGRDKAHARARRDVDVLVEERGRREVAPRVAHPGEFLRRSERGRGRVVEGAQHPRDVPEGRLLGPPLGRRPGRLTLEVEDHEAAVGADRLAQMVVAVNADLAAAIHGQGLEAAEARPEGGLAG